MKRRGWVRPALVVTAVVLVVGGVALYRTRRVDPVAVHVVQPDYEDIEQTVRTDGTVMPTDEFQARANFPGIVEKVYVELGDRVKPGQMLISMKDPFALSRMATARGQLEGARLGQENIEHGGTREEKINLSGDLKQAQMAHDQAVNALNTLMQLQAQGAASDGEVAAAEQKVQTTSATLRTVTERNISRFSQSEKVNAKVHVADAQAAMDAAKIQYENANITSTIAGVAYSIHASNYDFVPMGADLVRVADLNHVQIRAYFDEPEIGKLIAGQSVTITWDGRPDRTWHGHVKQAPVAATVVGPRSVGECIITVDDSKSELLPNTNVMVTVRIQRHEHVMTLPRSALRSEGGKDYLFRVADGKLVRTPVQLGLVNLNRFEVKSGVRPGEVVAWGAVDTHELRDGLEVRVVP